MRYKIAKKYITLRHRVDFYRITALHYFFYLIYGGEV